MWEQKQALLDREKGRIQFVALIADTQATHAVSLCKFLVRHGIPCGVEEDVSGVCKVQLRGVPDLDSVERLIGDWTDTVSSNPPELPSIW